MTLRSTARDLLTLGKPRVTGLVLFTTGVGLWIAPGSLGVWATIALLAGTAGLVLSANTLNCWIEREADGKMRRTRDRPLPAGRLHPRTALAAGLLEGIVALPLVAAATNPVTAWLGAIALASYVLVYTPLKSRSAAAVIIGAVPGAIPPLMGWTAVTGSLDPPGIFLFSILFLWQLPHFIAISLYLKEDYRRGGMRVLPLVHGDRGARLHLFLYTLMLVAVSLFAGPLGMAGATYAVAAIVLGGGFIWIAGTGLTKAVGAAWARRAFLYSLVYLTALIGFLVVDAR